MMRIRVTYQKTEALRYTGNLDLQKIWERYLRRANLPVAYSQGFHPQPRIQQACPLPLGFLGQDEQVDFYLDSDQATPASVSSQLDAAPYPGISILNVDTVGLSIPALSTQVVSAQYRVDFFDAVEIEPLQRQITEILASPQILRTRRGKVYDLRPLIEALTLEQDSLTDLEPTLRMQLSARQGATGRPEEVISALGYDPYAARYIRTKLIFLPN